MITKVVKVYGVKCKKMYLNKCGCGLLRLGLTKLALFDSFPLVSCLCLQFQSTQLKSLQLEPLLFYGFTDQPLWIILFPSILYMVDDLLFIFSQFGYLWLWLNHEA